MAPNLIPLPLAQLCYAHALAHVGEYVQAAHALTPNTFAIRLTKNIMALCHFHPLAKVDLPPFVDNFYPKKYFVLDRKEFNFCFDMFSTFFIQWSFGYGV